MLFVFRVLNRFKQERVSEGTTAILGRASPLALEAARITDTFFGGQRGLDLDDVLPIVAKVVVVAEPSVPRPHKIAQPHGTGVVLEVAAVSGIAVLLVVDHEGVHVHLFPAHRNLNDVV